MINRLARFGATARCAQQGKRERGNEESITTTPGYTLSLKSSPWWQKRKAQRTERGASFQDSVDVWLLLLPDHHVLRLKSTMGGIQAKAGSVAEVHNVRGGQLILRVAPSQTTAQREAKRRNKGRFPSGLASLGASFERDDSFEGPTLPTAGRRGKCYLLDQNMDILEKIFSRLSPRDLALLCLTSKAVNLRVKEFIEHYCASFGLPVKFKKFYQENEPLLLPKEEVLRERINSSPRPQLLMYSTMQHFIGTTRRISAKDVTERLTACAGWRNSEPPCMSLETDPSLKRDVLIVKQMKNSCCRPKFSHVFKNIPPGTYTLQLRLKLTNDSAISPPAFPVGRDARRGSLKGNDMAMKVGFFRICRHIRTSSRRYSLIRQTSMVEVSAPAAARAARAAAERFSSRPGSYKQHVVKEDLVVEPIDFTWWMRVREHQSHHLESQYLNTKAVFDADSDWFFLRMSSIKIDTLCDVEFLFEDFDTSNNNHQLVVNDQPWQSGFRQGVVWDFLELKQQIKVMDL